MSRRQILIAVLASAGALMFVGSAVAAPAITEYSSGSSSAPNYIAAGPDGNIWFTDNGASKIGEIIPSTHAITEFALPSSNDVPQGIAAGPDGNLWFTVQNPGGGSIGEINPTTHAITEYTSGLNAHSGPVAITAGPGGTMWFTDNGGIAVGEINTSTHAISEFPITTGSFNGLGAGDDMRGIAEDSNGNMWFTAINNGSDPRVAEINTTTHVVSTFTPASAPTGIVKGPDGNMWFTEGHAIGEVNPSTDAISEFSTGLATNGTPWGIAVGSDGNLWFADANLPGIGEINPATHAISEFASNPNGGPQEITAGSTGTLWFTDPSTPAIGEVTIAGGGGGGGGGSPATPSVGHVTVSGTTAHVPISCKGSGTCSFKLTLSVTETIKGGKVIAVTAGATHRKTKKKAVSVGSASRTLTGGQSATVTVALNGTGQGLLSKHHTLKIKLVVKSGASTVATDTLTFVKHKKKNKH